MKDPQTKKTPKPTALRVKPSAIPQSLREAPQWVVWRFEWNPRRGEWAKVPHTALLGSKARSNKPSTWTRFETALDVYEQNTWCRWDGVGLVLTDGLGVVGIDLDECRDPKTGQVKQWAREIIEAIDSYTEVSPSGTGIRIIAKGVKPQGRCRKDGVEIYCTGRYLTITGQLLDGTASRLQVHERGEALARLHGELFPPEQQPPDEPRILSFAREDDDEILKKAQAAKNGEKFARLWAGDATGYTSRSEADLALCSVLAFWSQDPDQIDRLFRRSGLMRPKWDRDKYRTETIRKAIQTVKTPACGEPGRREATGTTAGERPVRGPQAAQLVHLAVQAGAEFFHGHDGNAYAAVPNGDHIETHRVKGAGFRLWLRTIFYRTNAKPPAAQAMTDAVNQMEAKAVMEGRLRPVFVRVAGLNDVIYLDLLNDSWQAVEIDAKGWRILDDSPVKFRRAKAMLALPTPERGGTIDLLRQYVNVTDDGWPLVLGWLVAALHPRGPYPVLGAFGEQGAAKSTTTRVCRTLVDPNTAPVRAEPREARDLAIAANNSWVVALDNASHLPPWLSDAYCRLSTGGGFSTRTLYENEDETIFDAQRPVIINAIEEVATRADLLDRTLLVACPTIPDHKRIREAEFWDRFNRDAPRILGALLDAVSAGLARRGEVQLPALPRMADFAHLACACAPGLGFTADDFLAAYCRSRDSANAAALDSSPIVPYFFQFLVGRQYCWEGTTEELRLELESRVTEQDRRLKTWPQTAKALSNVLRRLSPNLRREGVNIIFPEHPTRGRGRILTIEKCEGEGRSHRSQGSTPVESRAKVDNGGVIDRSPDRSRPGRDYDRDYAAKSDRSAESPMKPEKNDGDYGDYDDAPPSSKARAKRAEPSPNGKAH